MRNKGSVIIDDNPAAFLSPVLQSIEACADSPADVGRLLCEHAENAALFMQFFVELLTDRITQNFTIRIFYRFGLLT